MTKHKITTQTPKVGDIVAIDDCFAGVKRGFPSSYLILALDVCNEDGRKTEWFNYDKYDYAFALDLESGTNVKFYMDTLRYCSVLEE
jgi:hypothetical protein